jgi:hypothetical protein
VQTIDVRCTRAGSPGNCNFCGFFSVSPPFSGPTPHYIFNCFFYFRSLRPRTSLVPNGSIDHFRPVDTRAIRFPEDYALKVHPYNIIIHGSPALAPYVKIYYRYIIYSYINGSTAVVYELVLCCLKFKYYVWLDSKNFSKPW